MDTLLSSSNLLQDNFLYAKCNGRIFKQAVRGGTHRHKPIPFSFPSLAFKKMWQLEARGQIKVYTFGWNTSNQKFSASTLTKHKHFQQLEVVFDQCCFTIFEEKH